MIETWWCDGLKYDHTLDILKSSCDVKWKETRNIVASGNINIIKKMNRK
jgi:hypothetical protein